MLRRRLLNLLTALSLLLFVAVCVLWPYSYLAYDAIGFWPSPAERPAYGLLSHHGTICLFSVRESSGGSRWNWMHDRTRMDERKV